MTDSFSITNELKNYLFRYNDNHDYFRVFNKDEGTLDDIVNINKICVGRCILANTKILYGVDLQFHYDISFFIYKHSIIYLNLNYIKIMKTLKNILK